MAFLIVAFAVVGVLAGEIPYAHLTADDDLITSLPGLAVQPSFRQYSGYIAVDDSDDIVVNPGPNTRFLHYWFVESARNPMKDPVVFWTNGGPGCSGLMGLMTEHGPFHPTADGSSLYVNPYSWNNIANMLYVEQPSGVGFSYGGNYTSGDSIAAHDNWRLVVGFLARHSNFSSNPFYVSGESFGGNYVPELAYEIMTMNEAGRSDINLKGFLVGNPTGINTNSWSHNYAAYMRNHALLSDAENDEIAAACNHNPNNMDAVCEAAVTKYYFQNWYAIDPYNVLAPCVGWGPAQNPSCAARQISADVFEGRTPNVKLGSQTFVPCMDYNATITYLNRADVKAALHISPKAFPWDVCSSNLNYNQYQNVTPMYYYMFGKIDIMVYSGDLDSCVPYIITQQGILEFNLEQTTTWRRWMYHDNVTGLQQVAGYFTQYDGITYATVRGAGHMVPMDKPQVALELFMRYFNGTWPEKNL